MRLQVLVSTMHQTDYSLLDKMNIQSDAIIINQCNRNETKQFTYSDNTIKFMCFNEQGVGLSRNSALMRATADVCLLSDDDVTYVNNYKNLVLDAFKKQPEADMIVFNVPSTNPDRSFKQISKQKRVRLYNSLKYGAVRMAIRTQSVRKENIYFSLLFGGGAKYGSGEDSLFIFDCIKKGLKVYTDPTVIGEVSQSESTWFNGYTEKYFFDKGALFARLSHRWSRILAIQFLLRHREILSKELGFIKAYKLMLQGMKDTK